MSNSPLVSFTKISPSKSTRTAKIDTITIHCVVGQCSVETLGALFANASYRASSNYGVGKDGRIGMYVEEKDRSWCSSNTANDNRAVTIEVASDNFHPYAVNDVAYNALIKLVADICKRNGIKKLLWKADKSLIGQPDKQNMTVHRWFANKACPGDYLYNRMGDIAEKANKIIGGYGTDYQPVPTPSQNPQNSSTQTSTKKDVNYIVRVKIKDLNIRSGPGTQYTIRGKVIPGAYTIIQESNGTGASKWGKLKSGAGWISLDYVTKLGSAR